MSHSADIGTLKNDVFERVAASREQLAQGHVDLTPVETSVRAYCEGLSALPIEGGRLHTDDLHALSEAMNMLEEALKTARDQVKEQLTELNQHRKAHKAYLKSDGIGEVYFAPDPEDK